MNSFEDDVCWGVLDDYNPINDFDVSDLFLRSPTSANVATGTSLKGDSSAEKGLKRVRDQENTGFQADQSKSCRERLRREKMNDRFAELRKYLNLGRSTKSDKSTILQDAICAVYKLKSEHQELKDRNKKLQNDALNLKVEKNELREEKLQLQTAKQKIEQQMETTNVAQPRYMPMQAAVQPGGGHKGVVVTGYGGYPMWQWIPPSVLDISHDHVLRPPVA